MKTIEQFTSAVREQFPEVIRLASDGEVEQIEDRQLMAWTAGGEDALEIVLSNGAAYQIKLRQTARASEECSSCGGEFDESQMIGAGGGSPICEECWQSWESQQDVPSEHPYDCAGRVA